MSKNWPKGGRNTERWRKSVEKVADWVPVDFALAWIDTESGGNPTVTTNLGERGLFQVHPDEVEFLKLTQEQFHKLTTDTKLAVSIGIRQLKLFAAQARKDLAKVNQQWHGRDFWKLVKLYHGAFGMPGVALNAFVRSNKRSPDNWNELQAFALGEAAAGRDLVPGNPQQSRLLRALTPGVFANADKTGEASELPIMRDSAKVALLGGLFRTYGAML